MAQGTSGTTDCKEYPDAIQPVHFNILVGLNRHHPDTPSEREEVIAPQCCVDPSRRISLGLLDLIEFKLWTPILYAFENIHHKKEFMRPEVLKRSLEKALEKVPILTGSLETSSFTLEDGSVVAKDTHVRLTGRGVWFCTNFIDEPFDNLKQNHFFYDQLPSGVLFRTAHDAVIRSHEEGGPEAPLFFVKANYFPCGSVLLMTSTCHVVADGRSMYEFMKVWGDLARDINADNPLFDARHRYTHSNNLSVRAKKLAEDAKLNSITPRKDLIPTKIIRVAILCETMKLLKDRVNLELQPMGSWVSTNDILCAVMWRAMTRARGLKPSTATCLRRVIELRGLVTPPLPPTAFGNGTMSYRTEFLVSDLLSQPLSQIALSIRSGAKALDHELAKDHLDALGSMAIKRPTIKPADFKFGTDILSNSYASFPPQMIDFDGAPAMASLRVGMGDGQFIPLPTTEKEHVGHLGAGVNILDTIFCDSELLQLGFTTRCSPF